MHMNIHSQLKLDVVVTLFLTACGCSHTATQPQKGPIPPGDYKVVSGDDLNNIALRAYGDGQLCYSLLNANPKIAKRPSFKLMAGETLKIPAKADLVRSRPKSAFPKKLPADYIVMPGDSLPLIAKGCYGDRNSWLTIYEANRSILSEKVKDNPSMLIAGQVLRIPATPKVEQGVASKND